MATVELPEGAVAQTDERLEVFEGDTVLVSSGQSLLSLIDEIDVFNEKYLSEKDDESAESEYRTFWSQVKFAQKTADEPEEGTPKEAIATAQKLSKAIATAQEKLQDARNAAANWAAEYLGVEVATEKPKLDKDDPEYKRIQEQVRKPAVTLAQTLRQLADGIGLVDPDKKATILSWLNEYPIPQVGREGSLNVTADKETAKRHRVDIWATDEDGKALFGTGEKPLKGFTAVAQKNRKDQPVPDADTLRKVYEDNDGPNGKTVEFSHEGVTYRMVKRA